jgi:hypothetical protein
MQAGEHLGGILLGSQRESEDGSEKRDEKTASGSHAKTPMGSGNSEKVLESPRPIADDRDCSEMIPDKQARGLQ